MSDTEMEHGSVALLDKIHANGGVMTFKVKPGKADVFRLLEVLKDAELIEEIPAPGLLNFRYRVTDGQQSK